MVENRVGSATKVHPHFPLHAVKLKNTTDRHLMQGPMAIFDRDGYLGDCRVPDLAPIMARSCSGTVWRPCQ
jgi:hypothetical protein